MTGKRQTLSRTPRRGFPPVFDRHVRTLILGSFPSEKSLAKGQYYGHPQNQFWRLVGRVIDYPLHDMPYKARLEALLCHHIGLWDVLESCTRAGSLDSAIRDATHNRFAGLTRVAQGLCRVCFNGRTAGALEPWFAEQGYETFVLPSSSPANTTPFPVKLRTWRRALAASGGNGRRTTAHRSLVNGHAPSC